MSRALPAVLLLAIWLALWGEVSWANVVSGVLMVALLAWMLPGRARRHRVHLPALVRLVAVFAGRLVTSSLSVVRTVLRPTPDRLRSGVVAVPLGPTTPLVATVVADAISLTPGTLTLDVRGEPAVLYVHVLGLGDRDAVTADVRRLQALVTAALTPVPGPEVGA